MALVSVRDRIHRVRVSLDLSMQAAIAAGPSWFVAHNLLGHIEPFFAPLAAVVVLAISVGQRLRRAVELVAGNAVGILLGEVIILAIGRGARQVGLVVPASGWSTTRYAAGSAGPPVFAGDAVPGRRGSGEQTAAWTENQRWAPKQAGTIHGRGPSEAGGWPPESADVRG